MEKEVEKVRLEKQKMGKTGQFQKSGECSRGVVGTAGGLYPDGGGMADQTE